MSELAMPVIRQIVNSELRVWHGSASSQDAEDVCSDAEARLLKRLRALHDGPHENPIADFPAYVAEIARNSWDQSLRRAYPERARLKNQVRYLLGHRRSFALWQNENQEWLCGFEAWKNRRIDSFDCAPLQQLLYDPSRFIEAETNEDLGQMELEGLLKIIFQSVNCPIGLNPLVGIISDLTGIRDRFVVLPREDDERDPLESLPDTRVDIEKQFERSSELLWLWTEICRLPLRQRTALLLNLRDAQGQGVIALFPLTGVATLRQIADALAIPAEQLAELYNRLPLDDATIAQRLGLTRQQVINLRKAARERLGRRVKSRHQET